MSIRNTGQIRKNQWRGRWVRTEMGEKKKLICKDEIEKRGDSRRWMTIEEREKTFQINEQKIRL